MDVVETACPVPVIGVVPEAFPAILSVAVLAPTEEGENVIITVQDAEVATEPPFAQVPPVRAKFAAFAPVIVKNGVESVSVAEPVFETVTVSGELVVPLVTFPKAIGLGEMETTGVTGAMPVPVSESVPVALPAMFSVAALAPRMLGVNVSRMVHVPEGVTVPALTQVPPDRAKFVGFAPVMVKNGVLKTRFADPVFVTVTVVAELVVPCT